MKNMDKDELQRIENYILGSKWERYKKKLWSEFYFFEKRHGSLYNRVMWITFFGLVLVLAYAIGSISAMSTFPQGKFDEEEKPFENFDIDYKLKNNSHNGNLLVIETEWMSLDFTLYNNYEKDVAFKVYSRVSNSNENTYSGKEEIIFISEGGSQEGTKKFPLKYEGINNVSIHFVMYEVYEDGSDKGKLNILKKIESGNVSKSIRTFTYSDFNALHEQSIIYTMLWVVIAPFTAITIKHIRDLVEGR